MSGRNKTHLSRIFRYPVKGLRGQELESTELIAGQGIEHDRRFALATRQDISSAEWMPPRTFLINAITDGLLAPNYEFSGNVLTMRSSSGRVARLSIDGSNLETTNEEITSIFSHITDEAMRLVELGGQSPTSLSEPSGYFDFRDSHICIINLASIRALEKASGLEINPERFRGNLMIDGLGPWEEFSFLNHQISIGEAQLKVIRPALRCPATAVNTQTGERDLPIPRLLADHFGHGFCGMYAQVVKGETIQPGDALAIGEPFDFHFQDDPQVVVPPLAQWPRMAKITGSVEYDDKITLTLQPDGPVPLVDREDGKRMRLHMGAGRVVRTDIEAVNPSELKIIGPADQLRSTAGCLPGQSILCSGPFGKPQAG